VVVGTLANPIVSVPSLSAVTETESALPVGRGPTKSLRQLINCPGDSGLIGNGGPIVMGTYLVLKANL